jgi:plastocyanin
MGLAQQLSMRQIAFLVLILAALMIFGCTGPAPEQNETNQTPPTPPPVVVKTPSFTISTPLNQEVLTVSGNSANITLTLNPQNLVLKKPSGAAKKGEGYFQVTLDNNAPEIVTSKVYTLSNVAIGTHSVKVDLYNNDKTPYSPALSKSVAFTIAKEKPKEYVPQNYNVTISGNKFTPSALTVKTKDSVTWKNDGSMPASATCTIDGKIAFDTKTIAPGQSATLVFTDPLTCEYYSQLFRAMKGTITVEPNGVDG